MCEGLTPAAAVGRLRPMSCSAVSTVRDGGRPLGLVHRGCPGQRTGTGLSPDPENAAPRPDA